MENFWLRPPLFSLTNGHFITVTIASNGRTGVTSIQEGGGLSDLRRRLEQEGASLLMEVNDGVVMHVTIPVGENG